MHARSRSWSMCMPFRGYTIIVNGHGTMAGKLSARVAVWSGTISVDRVRRPRRRTLGAARCRSEHSFSPVPYQRLHRMYA